MDHAELLLELLNDDDFQIYEDNHFLFSYEDYFSSPWYIQLFLFAGIIAGAVGYALLMELIEWIL